MSNSTELARVEKALTMTMPTMVSLLHGTGVDPERMCRTILVSCERNPALVSADRQSLINAALSASVLGLECDGYTGQAFLIPFKSKVQLIVGYKGYNTLAARAGWTINAAIVREGDEFEFELGSRAFIGHRPKLGNESKRKIIGAWAAATAAGRAPIIQRPLSIDEILAIKAKSPGARKPDSPWNDPAIGFPAMAEKSAKRRLARSMPLSVMQLAAAMEDHVDRGQATYITPTGTVVPDDVIDAEVEEVAATPLTPETADILGERAPPKLYRMVSAKSGEIHSTDQLTLWSRAMRKSIDEADPAWFAKHNLPLIEEQMERHPDDVSMLLDFWARRKEATGYGD